LRSRWTPSFDQYRGDLSFALMLSAQARGAQLWYYHVTSLAWEAGRLSAQAAPVTVQRVEGALHDGRDAQDRPRARCRCRAHAAGPPFDLGYITATHLLERLEGETLVVNDPRSVRNAPEGSMCSITRTSCRPR
jgi:glutathione synthase